ncbi:periplasmic binding protein [Thermodesulfatator indicus DSM 15286]|uniref:Periplasmic binding protein n=1 Tax=Thermodesulfatator indicus (strain DSM 15286 / JCM 11887 / CIR29812) TaxID=667014 RepID=F8AB18_THEID|nr:ABC transporter substrate-binding protein [Thermodesulfatator indicus]AEH44384.1 periplasmic binding protein [Thermodesulfatator indicus DSM 15286]
MKKFLLCLLIFFFFPLNSFSKTLTIKDALNRTVKINAPVKKAIFLVGYEIIPFLDLWHQTVGISLWAKYENDLLGKKAKDFVNVGTASNPNIETIVSLKPDLVITWPYNQRVIQTFESLGIPTYTISPNSLYDLFNLINDFALIFGKEERGNRLINLMRGTLNELNSLVANAYKPGVVFTWGRPTRISGKQGVVPDLIRIAGGKNLGDKFDRPYIDIPLERLVILNPEVIFIWGNARYNASDLLKDERLSSVSAVKNKKVYKTPEWSTWSPRAVLIALWMGTKLHPELVTPAFFKQKKAQLESFITNP